MELLAGAVVDKLIGGSHGSQRMPTSTDFLIKRVGVKRARCDVGPGFGHLKIFVAQIAHVVEFFGEERKNILVRSCVSCERSESESLLCLSAVCCEPLFCEGEAAIDGVFQSRVPFPQLCYCFDARGDKVLREPRNGSGRCRGVCDGTRQAQDNLISVETDSALDEAGEAFDLDIVAAINLDDPSGARLSGDDERIALLCGERQRESRHDEERGERPPGFDGIEKMVDERGFEPPASSLRTRRSPS
jgi:hypothetical protein